MLFRLFRRCQHSWSVRQLAKIDLSRLPVENVVVSGWIQNSLRMKGKIFIRIRDGLSTDLVQVVVDKQKTRCTAASELSVGAAATVTGTLVPSKGSQQPIEILASAVDIVGAIDYADFPFTIKAQGHRDPAMTPEKLRSHLEVRAKMPEFAAMLRLRSRLKMILQQFFAERDFVAIDTPLLTTNDCEGAGETFSVEVPDKQAVVTTPTVENAKSAHFFHRPVSLTVSGQLHLEAITAGIPRVYTFNPAFRADRSETPYHLAEFVMLEAEIAFVDSIEPLMNLVEEIVKHAAGSLLKRQEMIEDVEEVARLFGDNPLADVERLATSGPFTRVTASEARSLLNTHHPNTERLSQRQFSKEEERRLCALMGDAPLFVTDFPCSDHSPFYARRRANDAATTLSFDLLCPRVGELCGGTVREPNAAQIQQKLTSSNAELLQWYVNLRRWGQPPTGGFGIGFDRMCQYLFGVKSIKDVTPFPRWKEHCSL